MRIPTTLVLSALSATVVAQSTVYPTGAPRAEVSVIAGSDVGAPALSYWGGCATDGSLFYVFGGRLLNSSGDPQGVYYRRLDAYDPVANTWTNLSPNNNPNAPSRRFRSAMAYDPANHRLVVFGGEDSFASLLGTCYAFDLTTNTWSEIPTSGVPSPNRRTLAKMAYDAAAGGLLLFGGQTNSGWSNDTWLLSGTTWTQLSPATSPSPRTHHAMTARSAPHDDIVVFGGRDQSSSDLSDLWRWDSANTTWHPITPANGTTAATSGDANEMVHDSVRDVLVIIGGIGNNIAPSNTIGVGGWISEFDCVTEEWRLYGQDTVNQATPDPIWGSVRRFPMAFVDGATLFWSGQNFGTVGDSTLRMVKRYQSNQLATATSYGTGCVGQGGLLTLLSNGAPWTGRTWSGTCSNVGAASIALNVFGFATTSIDLHPLLGFALPGCLLLNTADVIPSFGIPVGGQTTIALALALDPALAGVQLHAQVAELDFLSGTLATSNGVTLTIGAL